jgi:plasmid stabilization system protein ParE
VKVVYATAARTDFADIGLWIAEDSPARAASFVDELYNACERLAGMPKAFPVIPRRSASGIRRRPYREYLIFYRAMRGRVEIVRIIHGARDYEKILFPK